jgi:ATP-dependent RNA helicase DHX57
MGGITNRDEKRKKNKVFSSGGGGGTKGPSVLDKRGQELQCPHCDRIFKQTGRLNEHVKKQHSKEAGGEDAEDAEDDGRCVSAAGSSSSSSTAAPPAAPLPTVPAPRPTPTSTAGAEAAGKGQARGAGTSPAAVASAGGPPPQGGGMMDVGSRAGAYTSKSPKLLLHEWLIKEKRPKPRYKTSEMAAGTFTCKVRLSSEKSI